jgi:osomolarity two-component system sensor histidine kinase NIK1
VGRVAQLNTFAAEVTRVANEVGTEGKLGGQAVVPQVKGTWAILTDNVNRMADNLTNQVRSIAAVTTAVALGDLSQKIEVEVKGEILQLKDTVNGMVDFLRQFSGEVTRVAVATGTHGVLGQVAAVEGVSGEWRNLTNSVNTMSMRITDQVRSIAQVTVRPNGVSRGG